MACKKGIYSPRLDKEILTLKKNPPSGISCYPKQECQKNVLSASIVGASGSPYEKGVFQLEIIVTERYPFEPPRVRFTTPIYHPNVDAAGRICLDMLKMPPSGSWKPIFTIEGVLTTIQCLMTNPNPDDPLMPDIASQYKYSKEQFDKDAEAWTIKHARANTVSTCVTQVAVENNENLAVNKRKSDGFGEDTENCDGTKKRTKIE
ncbi:ubiquitin-conjugating enzyme E2 T-like [Macrosteles quadrilineatus]|uniref:ubiquitin-conjugating enzyme E2 T-like n=1 Tax=Macrosteles quadrilineatus TaxID=74068 RepID=UPI0023E24A0F|nr:ubiquitin-conjugating enzyme E2 T-like [Macrosteles quadrilineatus]